MWSTLIWAILILIIVILFKKHIDSLFLNFSNKAKIKFHGIDIDLSGGSSIAPLSQLQQSNYKHFELQKAFQSLIVTSDEKFIRERLIEAKLTPDQAIELLINHLSNSRLNIAMLVIDKLIFEEQTELLSFLNIQIKPCPENDLFIFYKKWQERTKNTEYSFLNFKNFLLQQQLIAQNIEGYSISLMGKEYLSFLVRVGKPIFYESPQQKNESKEKEPDKSSQ